MMEDGEQELRGCPNPWCSSISVPVPLRMKREGWRVMCSCGVATWRVDTEDDARTLWNTRAPDPAIASLTVENERLRGCLGYFAAMRMSSEGEISDCVHRTQSEELRRSAKAIEDRDAAILDARAALSPLPATKGEG